MTPETLEILYNGYREWMVKVKGFATCASKAEIAYWEQYKGIIFDRLQKSNEVKDC